MDRSQGRTGGIVSGTASAPATFTGNKALQIEEPLIFEMGQPGRCGVDLPEPPPKSPGVKDRLNGLRRSGEIGLPGLDLPAVTRLRALEAGDACLQLSERHGRDLRVTGLELQVKLAVGGLADAPLDPRDGLSGARDVATCSGDLLLQLVEPEDRLRAGEVD